jgi:hypothetical protein
MGMPSLSNGPGSRGMAPVPPPSHYRDGRCQEVCPILSSRVAGDVVSDRGCLTVAVKPEVPPRQFRLGQNHRTG